MDGIPQREIERFWAKVTVLGPDECWVWRGGRNKQGYGVWYSQNKQYTASRWILGVQRGKFLSRDVVGEEDCCHTCDNPPCVNPAHLYAGTRKQNIGDAVERSRLWQLKRTHCPQGHPLETKPGQGRRFCRACSRQQQHVSRTVSRTHCKNGHLLSDDNVLLCRNGTRKCRVCDSTRASLVAQENTGKRLSVCKRGHPRQKRNTSEQWYCPTCEKDRLASRTAATKKRAA